MNNLYQVIYYGDSQTEVGKPFAISCIISIADPVEWHKDGEPLRKHSNIRHGKDEHSYIESEMGIAGNVGSSRGWGFVLENSYGGASLRLAGIADCGDIVVLARFLFLFYELWSGFLVLGWCPRRSCRIQKPTMHAQLWGRPRRRKKIPPSNRCTTTPPTTARRFLFYYPAARKLFASFCFVEHAAAEEEFWAIPSLAPLGTNSNARRRRKKS